MRWLLESWQPPRPQTGETGHLQLPEGDRPMPVAFHKMLGLVSSDAGFRALDEVWAKLCRGSTTPTPWPSPRWPVAKRQGLRLPLPSKKPPLGA